MNGKEQERNVEILLKMDGIMAKGYGVVAKFPMRDTALKIKDKAIYAYLCAISGGGIKAWPSRGKLMADLQIGKTAFYNSMDRLIQEGYLTKTSRRIHGERGLWTRTVYTIELNPKRYQDSQADRGRQENLFSTLEIEGMMGDGWGFSPRLVMQDPRLSIQDKALYVYILTYVSAGRVAYPDVSTITYHLGISEDTYRTLIRRLCQLGYIIRRRKRKSNGQLGGYDYFICPKPSTLYDGAEGSALPPQQEEKKDSDGKAPATPLKQDTAESATPSKRDTVKQDSAATPFKQDTADLTTPVKRDTVNQPPPPKPDTVKPDTANEHIRKLQGSSITSFSITSQETHKPTTTTGSAGGTDGKAPDLPERIEKAGGMPTDILDEEAKVTDALRLLADWNWKSGAVRYCDPEIQSAYQLVMDTLVILCTRKTARIGSLTLTREQFVEKLNQCCEKDRYGIFLSDFIQFAACD